MHGRKLTVLALAAVGAVAVGLTGASGATTHFGRLKMIPGGPITGSHSTQVPLALSNKRVTYILEMSAKPVAAVDAAAKSAGHGALNFARRARVARQIRSQQAPVIAAVKRFRGAQVIGRYQGVYNGISVTLPQRDAWKLSSISGVKAVFASTTFRLTTAPGNGIPITNAPQTWGGIPGLTGDGMKIADLDTGIDYTHADFGGSGSASDYNCALASDTADPSTVVCSGHPLSDYIGPGAPKIKGGIDLVGDDYNANPNSSGYQPVPHPDNNPLDCNSHGTHTAGTLAGFGVDGSGNTYTGTYGKDTNSNGSFAIPPGMAPRASLYSVRVFGCSGSVDDTVLLAAMNWAFNNHMDVVNMSLGGDFGSASDPDSVAASNLAAEGVITVVASGNAGPSPYMTSSPAAGLGALSVAASDSTQSFPAARLTLTKPDTTSGGSTTAIDANGVTIAPGTYDLKVIYSSPGVMSLGCSVADDEASNGNAPFAANTIIVVARGTCARVAKAIYGQQAGAAGVIMVNNSPAYPPYEGPITSNPDDNTPYTVTIPFLGVRGSPHTAAEQLIAADGGTVTLAAFALVNPGFRGLADFSSWGPSPGGILKPEVTAPGVSIVSAGMGTGNGILLDSGTSMATPHTAGEAALVKQAHPSWGAVRYWKQAIANTASPAGVARYAVRGAGAGLINAYNAVHTNVVAGGYPAGTASLSFGAPGLTTKFVGTKTITLRNFGDEPATFRLSDTRHQGISHTIVFNPDSGLLLPRRVTVPAHGKAFVPVQLDAIKWNMDDPISQWVEWSNFGFFADIAGVITLTPLNGSNNNIPLSVPYYLVPTAVSNVKISGISSAALRHGNTDPVTITNTNGLGFGVADWFSWGGSSPVSGADIGSADLVQDGIQSDPGGGVLLFALHTTKPWANPAQDYFEIDVDVNDDATPDYAVLAVDFGLFTTGVADGESVVVVYDLLTDTFSIEFLTMAAFNGTTMELPVLFSQLCQASSPCISSTPITYKTFSQDRNGGTDQITHNASFNVMAPSLLNSGEDIVHKEPVTDPTRIDPAAWAANPQRGILVLSPNNQHTLHEAFHYRLHLP